ncbi:MULTISPECIES: tyrosine-type recombinase/integrase [unclassified Nitratiruptor]|uniref:tyrosine-type recombinase/integrase n=1 Tax=unclassified Nitratiruptor TaxID=2624044 RepID=UPI001916C215|nr:MULTISPECIES: tyrosine-type recombinase/integrase [unclassified Nitratiruptor]
MHIRTKKGLIHKSLKTKDKIRANIRKLKLLKKFIINDLLTYRQREKILGKSILIMVVDDDLLKDYQPKENDEIIKKIIEEKIVSSNILDNFNLNFEVSLASENGEDPKILKRIEKIIKEELEKERQKGKIKSISIKTDKNITSKTLKIGFQEFIRHKREIEKISKKTMEMYNKGYKYLLLFTDENEKIFKFTSDFFKDIQYKLLKIPSHTILKHPNLKYEQVIELYKDKEYKKLESRTINNIIIAWKAMFKFFEFNGYIAKNPTEIIKPVKEEIKNIMEYSIEELALLIKNFTEKKKEFEKDIVLIGLYTGMRIGEIANLKKENIDLVNKFIHVEKGKTANAKRKIPIHQDIFEIMQKYVKNCNSDNLFNINAQNKADALQKRVSRKMKNIINHERKSFHSLRKNFVIKLYENGIDENIIKLLVGHSTQDNITFSTYNLNKVKDSELHKAISTLNFLEEISKYKKNLDNEVNYRNINLEEF